MKNIFRRKIVQCTLLLAIVAGGILLATKPDDQYFEIAKNLDIFAAVFRDLNAYYVDSIQPAQLMSTGIEAMTESLDPYTTFYTPDNMDDLTFQTTGKYGGIGVSLRQEGDYMVVSDVYPGSPIQQADVKPGDIIDSLNGKSAKGITDDAISDILKGEPGTTLQMVVQNPVTKQLYHKIITRKEIDVKSIVYAGMVDPFVGYIRLQQFTEYCSNDFQQAFDSLKTNNPQMKGIIIDLRGNPGGLLEEAVKTANIFMDPGKTIVSTRGKVDMWNHVYKTINPADDDSIRVALIINRMSASASEILAGAFQDLDRGVIIGQRSFGKGLVQTTHNLPYNTKLKLTTAKYYTPSGRCIQAIDYAHPNADGSIAYIPDSLRKSFKTADGRLVKDGGGVEPDIKTKEAALSDIAIALLDKNLIFDFATDYYYQHPAIAPGNKFKLTDKDYSNFVKFLKDKDYSYQTKSEAALEVFSEDAKKEKYFEDIKPIYDSLKQKVNQEKENDLIKYKPEIMQLLAQEIADRYYPRDGRLEVDLQTDNDVKQAISILNNPQTYQNILEGKMDGPFAANNN